MLAELWQYKIQIIPVLLFLFAYEIPALVRRLKKVYYVPIYFSVYPLREINQDLSTYLAEDYMYLNGIDLSNSKAENLRKKIIMTSIFSAVIDALIVPLLIGFIASFVLDSDVFYQFLIAFVSCKTIFVMISLRNSDTHIFNNTSKNTLLILIYISYIGITFEMLRTSYNWALPYVDVKNWVGMFESFSSFFFGEILAQGLVFAVFVAIFTNLIADRKLREANVPQDE